MARTRIQHVCVYAVAVLALMSLPARELRGAIRPEQVSFELDIQPILTARGCNQGACHGKARGQNGFQLSLLGFDCDFDHAALTKNARGRRVSLASPESSLILQKATGQVPHGGGIRIEPDSDDYRVLLAWIMRGAPRSLPDEPTLTSITVAPTELFAKPYQQQSMTVVAHYSDGSQRDVTARTAFQSSEAAIVAVDRTGQVKAGPLPGEATVMARYMSLIGTCHVAIPLQTEISDSLYANLPRNNFIDDFAWAKLKSLKIVPSEGCDDAKFLRRAHLDIIGRLPTPDEVRAFLSDAASDKRSRLVDSLLERPEYADHWAAKWADLLRPNPYRVGIKAVVNYDQWIRDSFRKNKPYDQFVRELVSAKGSTWDNGASTLHRDRREPVEVTTLVSQLFLGVRLECAKCHHHPFEKWSQDDFYSFAAFFAKVGHKGAGLSPPISGGEEIVLLSNQGKVEHPLTGKALSPRPLFGSAPEVKDGADPRDALAAWITSDENPLFRQVIVNRVWADLMGRGLVEPIDDLRATNPPTNPELLAALAEDFKQHKYDLKHLIRTICNSQVYARSSMPNEHNAGDRQNYSRHYRTRLRAEVLLDAVADVTGTSNDFEAMPAESRANQIWTTRIDSIFLDTFGRPNPNQDPPCERTSEPTVTQTLHLMNSPGVQSRILSDASNAARLGASKLSDDEIIEEVYLLAFSRLPEQEERAIGRQIFADAGGNRRRAAEDLIWALINTPEFVFKD